MEQWSVCGNFLKTQKDSGDILQAIKNVDAGPLRQQIKITLEDKSVVNKDLGNYKHSTDDECPPKDCLKSRTLFLKWLGLRRETCTNGKESEKSEDNKKSTGVEACSAGDIKEELSIDDSLTEQYLTELSTSTGTNVQQNLDMENKADDEEEEKDEDMDDDNNETVQYISVDRDSIRKNLKGENVRVHIDNLVEPNISMQVRNLNEQHVKEMAERIQRSYDDYTVLIGVLDQTCELDKLKFPCQAKIQVLGGNHTRAALQQLKSEGSLSDVDKRLFVRMDIYHGLSNKQALHLAYNHNEIHENSRQMTFEDKVNFFHTVRERVIKNNQNLNNRQIASMWRDEVATVTSRTKDELKNSFKTHLLLASFDGKLWEALQKVFDASKADSLKQGKKKGPVQLSQYYFMKFSTVKTEEEKLKLLEQLVSKQISLDEFKELCSNSSESKSKESSKSTKKQNLPKQVSKQSKRSDRETVAHCSNEHDDDLKKRIGLLQGDLKNEKQRNAKLLKEIDQYKDQINDARNLQDQLVRKDRVISQLEYKIEVQKEKINEYKARQEVLNGQMENFKSEAMLAKEAAARARSTIIPVKQRSVHESTSNKQGVQQKQMEEDDSTPSVQKKPKVDESRHPQHVDLEPIRQPTPPRLQELQYHPRTPPSSPPPRTPYDERPLPAMKNKDPPRAIESTPPPRLPYDERPLPVKPPTLTEEEPEQQPTDLSSQGITGEPEPMTEKELREASYAIDVFGEPLVSKAYSKTWSYREDALLAVYKQMQELPATAPKEESKTMMRASVFLVKRAIDDKVYAVFKAGLHLLKMILTEYIPKHKIQRQDTVYTVEKTMPNLLHKGGDTALRCREDIKTFIEEEAFFAEVKPTNIVPHDVIKPFKQTLAPRQAQSHCEIVEKLYQKLGIKSNSGLTVDNIMQFCVNALGHHSGEVRDVSERIIKELYKEVGQPVKDYLPPDNDKTRKITLYRQLFEFFDKVDGKPSKADLKKQRNDEEAKKQAEIDALQQQLQQLKDMASGKQPVDENLINDKKGPKRQGLTKKSAMKTGNKPKIDPKRKKDEDDVSMYNMDNICIFCGERNESFTEEGLDLHYWKHCPMLKRCTNCKQVVEIASYTEHLLTECEAKGNYAKCPRCSEAIPKSEFDEHVAIKSCNPSKQGTNHCPLCHQNIGSGEDGWKNHLMGRDGCKQNPRRLLALNKQPPTSKGKPTAKKKTPR